MSGSRLIVGGKVLIGPAGKVFAFGSPENAGRWVANAVRVGQVEANLRGSPGCGGAVLVGQEAGKAGGYRRSGMVAAAWLGKVTKLLPRVAGGVGLLFNEMGLKNVRCLFVECRRNGAKTSLLIWWPCCVGRRWKRYRGQAATAAATSAAGEASVCRH